MHVRKPILKFLVLLTFIVLITCFVAYRSGVFDAAPKNQPLNISQIVVKDTIKPKPDSLRPIMYSTKSGKVVDFKQHVPTLDSISWKKNRTFFMSSSKSISVPDPSLEKDLSITGIDSIIKQERKRGTYMSSSKGIVLLDSPKKDPKKEELDSITKKIKERKILMSSSKSRFVLDPLDIKAEQKNVIDTSKKH